MKGFTMFEMCCCGEEMILQHRIVQGGGWGLEGIVCA